MSGVSDNPERRRSEGLGNKRPRRDNIYLEELGMRGQLNRKDDKSLRNIKQRQIPSQETAEESDGYVQDQIIIAPEVMQKILSHLDLRTMKQVRLVCKSWLLEAQPHMQKRGTLCLERVALAFPRLWDFRDTRETKVEALPQPFMSLDVNLSISCSSPCVPTEQMFRKLSSLCPPLEIRRFFTAGIPLKLVLPFITQSSSSLEYLDFSADDSEIQDLIPWMEQDLNFPKLRHLFVRASSGVASYTGGWIGFPASVARIMKASPNIDTFSTSCGYEPDSQQLANAILLGVDITKVKTLQLKQLRFSNVASQHMSAIPFSQLQNLEMSFTTGDGPPWNVNALIGIARRADSTLKKLELLNIGYQDLLYLAGFEFPVCPTVEELHLELCNGWIDFVSRCFPSLQVFKTRTDWRLDVTNDGNIRREVSPFHNVNSLTLLYPCDCRLKPLDLFSLFPRLERLNVHERFFYKYFEKKNSVSRKCLDLIKGLKHLELHESDPNKLYPSPLLAQLKGLESISLMTSNKTIARLPLKELPGLKVIRFNWGECQNMKKLLEIARRVERVVVTNCCSLLRLPRTRKSKARLEEFFAAAPNVECGCKKGTEPPY